jgi:hypothetical protein
MRTGAEVSKYVTGRGGLERFSLCRRGDELLVFVEVEGEIREVKETPVFQQALVAFLREQGVQTEDLRRMAWQVLGKIWYRPRLLWRFLTDLPLFRSRPSVMVCLHKAFYSRPFRGLVSRRMLGFFRDNIGGFSFGSASKISDCAGG